MLTMMSTTMFIAARPVGIHGRCTAKNVRVSSRLTPPKGRLNANQNSAIDTRWVECGPNWPRWNSRRTIGVVSTIRNMAAGISSRLIWRMPIPTARRFVGDERPEHRVDQLVEVDDAEADGHRQHQHEYLAYTRVPPVDVQLEAEVDAAERAAGHQQLHGGRHQDRPGVDVELGFFGVEVR